MRSVDACAGAIVIVVGEEIGHIKASSGAIVIIAPDDQTAARMLAGAEEVKERQRRELERRSRW